MFPFWTHHAGKKALHHIDDALAKKPHKDGQALTAATQCLTDFRRDALDKHRGDPAFRPELERLNAVISAVLAIHFPLGEIPWKELEQARGWLKEVIRAE